MCLLFSTSNSKIYVASQHATFHKTSDSLTQLLNLIFRHLMIWKFFSAKNYCQSNAKGFALACKLHAYGTHIAFDTYLRQILLCVVISYC